MSVREFPSLRPYELTQSVPATRSTQAEVDGDERDDRDERLRASNVYRARELLHWEDSSKIEASARTGPWVREAKRGL